MTPERWRDVESILQQALACEPAFRDAFVTDACASDEEHNAALTAFYRNFGDVMSTDEIAGYIAANAATPGRASAG